MASKQPFSRRLMRRTMAPSSPVLHQQAWGLVLLVAVTVLGGLAVVAFFLFS
jgi:hypothetical protein